MTVTLNKPPDPDYILVGQLVKTVQNLAEVMVKLLEERSDGK